MQFINKIKINNLVLKINTIFAYQLKTMKVDLNLEERSLIALLIKDSLSLLKEYRRQSTIESNIDYYVEKIEAYKLILTKL
jgi:hypothetical protein